MSRPPQVILDELYNLASRLPWWGGLLSAVAVYAVLHPIAMLQMPTPTGMFDIGATALAQLLVFLAQIGQYLLPLLLLLGAAASAFLRWKRIDLHASVAKDATGTLLRGIPREDFELLVGEAFRRQGYQVKEARDRGADADAGVDLELSKDDQIYLVQCRHCKSWKVDSDVVHEMHRAICATNADGGFVVISGQFTHEAREGSANRNIELIDGRRLKELIRSERDSANAALPVARSWMRDVIGRWRERWRRIQAVTIRAKPRPSEIPDPSAGVPIRRELVQESDSQPGFTAVQGDEEAELVVGKQLAELIRSERLASQVSPVTTPRARQRTRRREFLTKIPARRIADAMGILIAAGVIWGTYQWFLLLPDKPTRSPWSLLGAGRGNGDADGLAQGLGWLNRSNLNAQDSPGATPLGQFHFGPRGIGGPIQDEARSEETTEVYRSVNDLETAFNAKYTPPPDCYDYGSVTRMAACGNHRIRARRAFIETKGKSFTLPEPRVPEQPGQDWDQAQEWWADQSRQEQQPMREQQPWQQERAYPGEQPWQQDQALPEDQPWRQERADPEEQPWQQVQALPEEQPRQQVQALPEERPWQQEQALPQQQPWQQDQARRQEQTWEREQDWARAMERRRERIRQRDSLDRFRQDAEQDWNRNWRGEPERIERRHWVDALE